VCGVVVVVVVDVLSNWKLFTELKHPNKATR
jgi:hypothetical protein